MGTALYETIYINFTGGIVSPGYLKDVLETAVAAKVKDVRFGLRQQMIIDVPAKQVANFMEDCKAKNIICSLKKEGAPNILSAYTAVDIFTTDTWVREGVYKDIFNFFDYVPAIKINITDRNQSFVPFFTGHANWISSGSIHFWYLYVRFPKTEQAYCFPELIYTNDIAVVSKAVEKVIMNHTICNENELHKKITSLAQFISKPIEKELQLPKFSLPYYEGFNWHNNNYWLGIYRRDETFPIQFLADLCMICTKTKIGQMYTTPWKSIIIKNIENTDRSLWDYTLGKYRINVRHAANELNWQVEDDCEDGLQLKRHLIRFFDKEDVRTYGLSFAVKIKPFSRLFGSIMVRKQQVKNPDRLKALERFEILYTADFNPNTASLIQFRKDVEKEHVGTYLVSLCKYFYERESDVKSLFLEPFDNCANMQKEQQVVKEVYQCKHCFSVYEEVPGDIENNIAPGTSFNDLPEFYQCSLCAAGKADFIRVSEHSLQLQDN